MTDPAIKCPECGADMVLRQTRKHTYGNGQPRKFYGCSRWPECNAAHGAHPDGSPVGIPDDAETKRARIAAHAAFDEVWRRGEMTRVEAYAWLASELGITVAECHIGRFDKATCERVVEVCRD